MAYFDPKPTVPSDGLAVIYDLADFTRFLTTPDAQRFASRFLNIITSAIDGGDCYWWRKDGRYTVEPFEALPLKPVQRKFLGDGELLIWNIPGTEGYPDEFTVYLMNRLWNLQAHFPAILKRAMTTVPIGVLPGSIRIGIARGLQYELHRSDGSKEYVGVAINLATRLSRHSQRVTFLASARLDIPLEKLYSHNFTLAYATGIKGFSAKEVVIVDNIEYQSLEASEKGRCFEDLPTA
jgi:class 3 adenylate cyclase